MTEREWLECGDPEKLLTYLQVAVSQRKCRLLAVACLRRVERFLTDARSRAAVEAAERMADGSVSSTERARLHRAASEAWRSTGSWQGQGGAWHAAFAAVLALWEDPDPAWRWVVSVADYAAQAAGSAHGAAAGEVAAQAALVRDLVRRPCWPDPPPAPLGPLNATVTALAEAAYEQRSHPDGSLDPARLAVLADALEEAGCTDVELLAHCRGPGPHVRGCWALDLVLGKE